ncbi:MULTISPECIES: MoaF N-terminal domain-containing protein [unclassified Flavobacterium]|uniref:MoaF-related domain-containing protein n=1 Tax=unclassified Flavobacterium TaxID=196869 RepID=UPI001F149216|nr:MULTISPECIES: MoaF N-terminal domain-containing protein [unclassified Flavobacterium]UMY65121.1 MoaF N-terminal domain-containing protein [Flavobacterium sp. HJ-32-4]
MIFGLSLLFLTFGVSAQVMQQTGTASNEIIGKTITITFPQFAVEETFVSDSRLHWKIVDDKGNVTEADETISYKKLYGNQFFVNWIEKSGLTVSQVLDLVNQTATAFVSRADEKSTRGQRSANFFQGTAVIKK